MTLRVIKLSYLIRICSYGDIIIRLIMCKKMLENEERNMLDYEIKCVYASLRKSEKKVADYVLANMDMCRKISLEQLADKSNVSQPTVVRFVKAIGYTGFKEFRYAVIEELSRLDEKRNETYAMYGYTVKPDDDLRLVPARVVSSSVKIIENIVKSISGEEFEKIIHIISQADRIMLCGVENSVAAAKDLMTKLIYLGFDCIYDEDSYIQNIRATEMTPKDVLIGISYTGTSKNTVDIMKAAKKAGATTICITNYKESVISKWSDYILCSSQEQWMYGDAIFSRSSQMVINDMLYAGLITNDYERCINVLDKNDKLSKQRAY